MHFSTTVLLFALGALANPIANANDGLLVRNANTCGPTAGACDKNGCEGRNDPSTGSGTCLAGPYKGCSCRSVCGGHNGPCDANGCDGINGVCTAGAYNGCHCN